ncbi:hypothetical protein E1218_27565 [Kribbella turkmenica]|uniref:Integrase catalytic domain-containing protein n=1 Tax=Kribbella turkmenica TaxID=2530375 RepID=A0A4R4WLV3_9ACTN|nr:hypothetical protein E1218_27565 [Kribbella turkmenica]
MWLADITEHRTAEGKIYLCAVKDVYSDRIVGYTIDFRMNSRLAVAGLNTRSRGVPMWPAVACTDRGSQFRSRRFVRALGRYGTGRLHEAGGDNGAMESIFTPLQNSVVKSTHVKHSRGTPDRDRDLDRTDPPPPQTTIRTRPVDPIEYETILTAS